MYEFATGPLTWFACVAFFGGALYKIVTTLSAARKDKVVYPYLSARFGLRSLLHWTMPFGSRVMRLRPGVTILSFAFHACLLLAPLFAVGHAVLWKSAWGLDWWSLPGGLIDAMTLVVIIGGAAFALRRIALPEVRNVTTAKDYLILLLVVAPFLTGFIAHHQWLPYRATVILHVVAGVLWLVAIPFTRLSHMLWFLLTRFYMGSDFGTIRNARDY